ncbi:MAG TPA: ATP-binding protein [Verrucomicrobiota bacterium]|nr:ATP-binding protein [Verrucomicrobiota bacterium]
MIPALSQWFEKLAALVKAPAADPAQMVRRIRIMELDIMLPLKVAGCLMLALSEYRTDWTKIVQEIRVAPDVVISFFALYVLSSIVLAGVLLGGKKLSPVSVQWMAILSSVVDALFLGALTVLTGGFGSIVFWLYFGLVIRNAISIRRGHWQLALNVAASVLYAVSALKGSSIAANLDEGSRAALGWSSPEEVGEPLFARLMVLWLTAACCHAVQVMLERQRHAEEEAREFATRESQLRSAGRLAAQIAHQIKNPLGIINNTAFSLRRGLKDSKPEFTEQLDIIREEVSRADQIITQLMGYAQLSEGRVERLDVTEELDRAIEEVFPSGVPSGVHVHRDYDGRFPPLLMQRKHISEAIINLLQNAREALGGAGNVTVSARCHRDYSVEIAVRDDGPGIPPDKIERVFEAYYTTKERGTGLGLALVKQNAELYGGTIRVQSVLGNGSTFTLLFPAKTFMRLGK